MCGNVPYWAKSVTFNNVFLENVQKVTVIAQIGPFMTSTLCFTLKGIILFKYKVFERFKTV